ncbi:choice-of-anchor Q domain-containing protein [Roseibacillus persicicus]|uniref:choice-of-anchor Q domain-containing protein n=1 Tax=Roseibacillus persicicus TaxID=454148 RepID=UPI00398AD580
MNPNQHSFFTLFLWFLLCCQSLPAASGGPDGYGYTWINSDEEEGPVYELIKHTPKASLVLENNTATAGNVDLTVPWGGIYGAQTKTLRISRNGYITDLLTESGNDETNDCPLPATPSVGGGNRIYVLNDNLELDTSTGKVLYEYFPSSPHPLHSCGVHVITWQNVHHATGSSTRFSFQALLFDNFDILLQFEKGNPEAGSGSTTGIQNADATIGLNIACDTPNSIPPYSAYLIRPPVTTVDTIVDEFDNPPGANTSLREALRDTPNGGRIEFDVSTSVAPLIDLSSSGGGQGSRITLSNRNLAIDGSTIAARPCFYGGGEVRHLLIQNGSHLSLCDLRFSHGASQNLFAAGAAGSTYVEGDSSLVANNCDYSQNFSNNEGGALFIKGAESEAHFHQCDFMSNLARAAGGAIAARTDANLTMQRCKLWLNRSSSSVGGALSLREAEVQLSSCDFAENEAVGSNGGAIVANAGVECELYACTFDANTAVNGGAIAAENSSSTSSPPAQLQFSRCTFFQNLAISNGGAVYEDSINVDGFTASFNFAHCTFYQNGCGAGGGALAVREADPAFQGVCVAHNTAEGHPDNFIALGSGGTVSYGDNLESGSDMGFTLGADYQNADPLLTDLGYYGGFVRTCMPLLGSPLIDAAIQGGAASPLDARGIASFQDGDPTTNSGLPGLDYDDIGAVELAPTILLDDTDEEGLQTAINSVARGGTIRISNTPRIEFSSVPDIPTGSMIFIEALQPTTFSELRLFFSTSEVALHGIDFDAGGYNNAFLSVTNPSAPSNPSSLSLHRCEVRNHPNSNNSAIQCLANSRLSLSHCEFRENSSEKGLSLDGLAHTIRDTHFSLNEPARDHVLVDIGSPALISRSSFIEQKIASNSSGRGALIRFATFSRDQPIISRIRNCTFANNVLTTTAFQNYLQPSLFEIDGQSYSVPWFILFDHLTIAGNTLGGPANTSLLTASTSSYPTNFFSISNSIFSNNLVTTNLSGINSGGGNLFDSSQSGTLGSDQVDTDPLLGPLALGRNGTRHYTLQPGSPAIDSALPSTAGITDGRGTIRYIDGDSNNSVLPDVGAVEAGIPLMVTTHKDENDGGLGLGDGDSLRECLARGDFDPVSISVDPTISEIKINSEISLAGPHSLDLNLAGKDLTLIFISNALNQVSLSAESYLHLNSTALQPPSDRIAFSLSENSNLHLHDCEFETAALGYLSATGTSQALATRVRADELNFDSDAALFLTKVSADMSVENSSFTRNASSDLSTRIFVQASTAARLFLDHCTIAENESLEGMLENTGFTRMRHCTWYRNGSNPANAGSLAHTSIKSTLFAANHGSSAFNNPSGILFSEGDNLSDLGDSFLQNSEDKTYYSARLAPLFDYDRDGVLESPPLAASPIFATTTGATDIPNNILVVNTTADENDSPAGPNLSLREAIRDLAPGGTILFDTSLNNASITLDNLALSKTLTMDATNLPSGIDLVGRAYTTSPDITIACHGIHFRDSFAESGNGGSLHLPTANLIASSCTFSGNAGFDFGGAISIGGDMMLENCTFAQLSASAQASAIKIEGGNSRISFCTFGECSSPSGGVIDLISSSSLYLYGCHFYDIARPAVSFGTDITSAFNLFSQSSVGFATATDAVGVSSAAFRPFADYGGYGPTYSYLPLTGFDNFITNIGAGVAQPPERDGRGFIRQVQNGIEPGSHEFGGEIAYGSDSESLFGDEDGLPAWWELNHGLNPTSDDDPTIDSDGDGSSLAEEFAWLTDPDDANSFFSCQMVAGPSLQWTTVPGYQYRVEESETLLSNDWDEVEVRTGNGSPETFALPIDPVTKPKNFFRIVRVSP